MYGQESPLMQALRGVGGDGRAGTAFPAVAPPRPVMSHFYMNIPGGTTRQGFDPFYLPPEVPLNSSEEYANPPTTPFYMPQWQPNIGTSSSILQALGRQPGQVK